MENVADNSSPTAPQPASAVAGAPPPATRRTVSGRIARWMMSGVLVCNLIVGGAVWIHAANAQAARASADLRTHLAIIQNTLAHIDFTQTSALASLSTQITPARNDMAVLINTLPFGGRAAIGPWAATSRSLQFGIACADATQALITTAIDLEPSLVGLRDSFLQGASSTGAPHHLLTLSDVHAAQGTLLRALGNWDTALAARAALSPSDITAAPLPGFDLFVQRFDQVSTTVTGELALASAVLDASPGLLGLSAPGQVLLLETDPDVARPTGGTIEHYGVLTFSQGALIGSIQLHTVASLDCPHKACPAAPLPLSGTWAPLSDTPVQLRDANLDPELQVSGYVMQRDFTQESGMPVLGVLVVTPALAADILGAIGPVTIPILHTTFTAANAQTWISYFHRNPVVPAPHNKSVVVDVDGLLAQAIVAKLPTLSLAQRTALGQALVRAIATKDIQMYTANSRIENALVQSGAAGSLSAPAGDSLYLVDTNASGLPAGPFIHESASDNVTLDAEGGATHTLRINYAYDRAPQGLPTSGSGARYTDVVRAVLPNLAANQQVVSGCDQVPATQAYHSVVACQLSLMPGQRTTLTLSWYVPHVYTPPPASGSAPRDYLLLIQRQPGSLIQAQVTVTAPANFSFAGALPPGRLVAGQFVWSAAPLRADTALDVSFVS